MSRSYYLVCRDCGVFLSLGQVYWQSMDGDPLDDVTMAGVFYTVDRTVHRRDEIFGRALEKFLVMHRNHLLVFAPEGFDELTEGADQERRYVEAEDLLTATIDPLPNPSAELEEWRRRLR